MIVSKVVIKLPVKISSNIQEPLDNRGILCNTTHMKNILAIVLIRQVDIIEQEREVHEESLGEVEVDGGALEEADMEHSLSHAAPVLHIPAVLSVEMRMSLW